MNRSYLAALYFVVWPILFTPKSFAQASADAISYQMRATFSVNDRQLATQSSLAVLTDEYFGGKTRALKILFTPEKITPVRKAELLKGDASVFPSNTEHAYLVLFLDDANKMWQINLSIILKGNTVVYTVAYKPEDFAKLVQTFVYDGTRLQLKSKGTFQDTAAGKNTTVTWDVNDSLPVYVQLKNRGGK